MKILYISQYFPPEVCAPAVRVSVLAQLWTGYGHDVSVLTGFPNHPSGKIAPNYRQQFRHVVMQEMFEGIRVSRTWLIPLPNRKAWERVLNYSSFFISATIRGLGLAKPDLVIGTSPQLLVGLAGLCIAHVHKVPFIFEVRDLWPESLVAVGAAGRESLVYKVLARITRLLYSSSDHIVVVSPAFKDCLERDWNVCSEKISVIPNGVRTDLFHSGANGSAIRQEWGLQDKFVVSFVGTIGNAHGLDLIVDAARCVRERCPDVMFLVVGDGAEREKLEALVSASGLDNIRMVGQQPRAKIPDIVCASDLCLVLLKRSEVFKTVIPTKMLEFMACGRPILAAVEGQAQQIVEVAKAGVCVEPENPEALADAIEHLHGNAALRAELGANGARMIRMRMSRKQTAADYLTLLETIHLHCNGRGIDAATTPNEETSASSRATTTQY